MSRGRRLALLIVVTGILAGCGVPVSAPPATPGPASPATAQPSPVSTSATLASSCLTGLEDNGSFVAMGSAETIPAGDYVADAYTLTLTNDSQATADVTGFAVVLYGSGHDELGSNQPAITETFITPGQALNFTETVGPLYISEQGQAAVGPYAVGTAGAIDTGVTCGLVQWDRG